MALNTIQDILNLIRQRYPALSKRMEEADALSCWDAAVGPQIAKHTRVVQVKDGVLIVAVDHPAWRSELHHRKRQILDILNKKVSEKKEQVVRDIFFVE